MVEATSTLTEKLALLQEKYIAKFKDRLGHIELALAQLSSQNIPGQKNEALINLEHLTHKLVGSGATYGFPDISDAARKIELACIEMGKLNTSDQTIFFEHFERLTGLVQDLAKVDPNR